MQNRNAKYQLNEYKKGRQETDLIGASETVKRQKNKGRKLAFLFVVAALVVGVYYCYTDLMVIKKCVVEGDLPYNNDEVLKGAGLDYGVHMYALSNDEIKENIVYNLPYIDTYTIKRKFPSTVVFNVTKAQPSMYTVVSDEMFVLSQSLRVLSSTKDIDYVEKNKLINVRFGGITKCVAGEFLVAEDNSMNLAREIYKVFEDEGLIPYVSELDVSDRFNINFNYKASYNVKLGDSKNVSQKIKFMKAISKQLTQGGSGIIDVSDENIKEGIVKNF